MGLFYALIATCRDGDCIAVPDIGYPIFDKLAPGTGVNLCTYRLRADSNYEVDLASLEEAVRQHRAKLVYVVNPSNPQGSVFSKAHVQDLYKLSQRLGTLILAD